MDNKDKPAYPGEAYPSEDGLKWVDNRGLTKREYFAAMVMQGILSRAGNWNNVDDYSFIYRQSIQHADNLLRYLDTSNQPQKAS